jgi:hypothetical protein
MAKFYVTYGCGSTKKNCFSVIDAETYRVARAAAGAGCNNEFAFVYDESEFAGQQEEYGLREVPLGPAPIVD